MKLFKNLILLYVVPLSSCVFGRICGKVWPKNQSSKGKLFEDHNASIKFTKYAISDKYSSENCWLPGHNQRS